MRGSKLDLLDNGLSRRCGGLRMAVSDATGIFKIASLSYDVYNKKLFGIVSLQDGPSFSSINFNFPYTAKPHSSDDELRRDMEDEARRMLISAASFQ
jgi:hypothetical protein